MRSGRPCKIQLHFTQPPLQAKQNPTYKIKTDIYNTHPGKRKPTPTLTFLITNVLSWVSSSSGVGGKGLLGALPELEPDPVAPGLDTPAGLSATTPRPAL